MGSEQFVLGQSALSVFRTALGITNELTRTGKIRYRVSAGGTLSLKVDDAALKGVLSKQNVEHKVFSQILDLEMSSMLNSILAGKEHDLITFRCDPDTNRNLREHTEEEIAEYRKLFEQKLTSVAKELVTDELRGKYLVKRTSKHRRLRSHSWEIGEKLVDKEVGKMASYPYATLVFDTITIDKELPEPLGLLSNFIPGLQELGRVESTTFDLDLDDLDDLIDSLASAKKTLSERLERKPK